MIDELMSQFDEDSDRLITQDEFSTGFNKIIHKVKHMVVDKDDSSRKYWPTLHKVSSPFHCSVFCRLLAQ